MINIFFLFFARIFESQLAISIVDKQSFYLFIYYYYDYFAYRKSGQTKFV